MHIDTSWNHRLNHPLLHGHHPTPTPTPTPTPDQVDTSWNHLLTIPSCMVITFFLLGIEELGLQIEEPFSILPMEACLGLGFGLGSGIG